jgi:hypothetical protein
MREITTYELPVLLGRLMEEPQVVLRAIHDDPKIKKRRGGPDGRLVIANTSKALARPEYEHQLYAKGIVYDPLAWKVVSVPLLKMHNHGMDEVSDATTKRMEGCPWCIEVAEKLDGTMVQSFVFEGRVWLATRGVIEGDPEHGEEYLSHARRLLEGTHALNPDPHWGYTLTYELIHPSTRVITDYRGKESMVLHGATVTRSAYVVRPTGLRFLARVLNVPHAHAYVYNDSVAYYEYARTLDDVARGSLGALKGATTHPEGFVMSFVDDDQVLHRVKVKTPEYVKLHALKFNATLKTVSKAVMQDDARLEWDVFRADVLDASGVELDEETLAVYREHHTSVCDYVDERYRFAVEVDDWVAQAFDELGPPECNSDYGRFVSWLKERGHGEHVGLFMRSVRSGEPVDVDRCMWAKPLHNGFRAFLEVE